MATEKSTANTSSESHDGPDPTPVIIYPEVNVETQEIEEEKTETPIQLIEDESLVETESPSLERQTTSNRRKKVKKRVKHILKKGASSSDPIFW